jgi:hypothetical protein
MDQYAGAVDVPDGDQLAAASPLRRPFRWRLSSRSSRQWSARGLCRGAERRGCRPGCASARRRSSAGPVARRRSASRGRTRSEQKQASALHQEQGPIRRGELEPARVDSAVGADRADGLASVPVQPEPPACRGVRPLGVGLPAERRTPGGGRWLGPAGRWVESMHGQWPFPSRSGEQSPGDPMMISKLSDWSTIDSRERHA